MNYKTKKHIELERQVNDELKLFLNGDLKRFTDELNSNKEELSNWSAEELFIIKTQLSNKLDKCLINCFRDDKEFI